MSGSWNSFQASVYHCVVKPAGSQVLNQRVPNEFTTTLPIIASRLTTKNTTSAQTANGPQPLADAAPHARSALAGADGAAEHQASARRASATMISTCTAAISIAIAEASE